MRRRRNPAQLALYGSQSVHVGYRGHCLMCKVLLALADDLAPCGNCPGWVEPAPPWVVLGEYAGGLETLQEAA